MATTGPDPTGRSNPTRRPKPVPRPSAERMGSVSDEERARIQKYDEEMAEYKRQLVERRAQQEAEYAARKQREADKASRMFASFDRAAEQLKQGVESAQQFDMNAAAEAQAQRKYDQGTPYRLLLKALPYTIPMGAAGYSLAIDGARAYKYAQQSALASNTLRNFVIGQMFKHPNSKIIGKLASAFTNTLAKPRFNSLLNIGKKQQLVADGVGFGFDAFQAGNAISNGDYTGAAINTGQGVLGVLGMLGTLGKLPTMYNNTMNVLRPASNGFEVGDDALNLGRLIK